jgi:hypothetical protein
MTTSITPYDQHFARLDETMNRVKANGYILIKGVEVDDEVEDDEGDDTRKETQENFTAEQMATIRVFLMTKKRQKSIKKAMKLASCDQDDGFGMFNTSTGNQVICEALDEVKKISRKKSWPDRFDSLFSLTYALIRYDCWIQDNELYGEDGELDQLIKSLADGWKKLLNKSNEDLAIDAEYTRPAIEELLTQFKKLVKESAACKEGDCEFEWH